MVCKSWSTVMQPTTEEQVCEAKRLLALLIECKFNLYTQGTTFVCDYDQTAAIAGEYDAMIEIQIQIIGGLMSLREKSRRSVACCRMLDSCKIIL
jgi:hypothetical protein